MAFAGEVVMGTAELERAATSGGVASRPSVTVYVASLNTAAATELCIRSAHRLAGHPLSIVVGDSGSTDGTLAMLRRLEPEGWLSVEVAGGGRYHAAWLDRWLASSTSDLAVFVDSDVEFREPGWLRALVDVATEGNAAVVAAELIPPVPAYRVTTDAATTRRDPKDVIDEVFKGFEVVRLARRPAPWLLLVDTRQVRSLATSFDLRAEIDPEVPEGLLFYDVGAWLFRAVDGAGLPWAVMPPSYRSAYHHYGGLSWIRIRGRRGLRKLYDLGRVRWHLAAARRADRRAAERSRPGDHA